MSALHVAFDRALGRRADNDNRPEPGRIGIARRRLLASRTVVACAAAAALTPRESFYVAEHAWAVEGLMRALARQDFSAWDWGDEQASPERWRLARRRLELHLLPDPGALERLLKDEFDRLWAEIAAPALDHCAA